MDIKNRASAIIIKDGKLLLVKWKNHTHLWTPWWHMESDDVCGLECLKRKLKEEINADVTNFMFFKEYSNKSFYHDHLVRDRVYLVSIEWDLKGGDDMEIVWVSKNQFIDEVYPMIPVLKEEIIMDLIKKGIF